MLVSLAAAAALFAGCGGGTDTAADTAATRTATQAAAAAPPATETTAAVPVTTTAFASTAPLVADTGPIAASDMDGSAQAEINVSTAQRDLATANAETAGSTKLSDSPLIPVADKAGKAPDAAPGTAAEASSEEAHQAASALATAVAATRSGGRTVPLPSTTEGSTSGSTMQIQEAVSARSINTADIRLQVEADRLFSSYKWAWGMECSGQKVGAVNIPEYGLLGFDLGNGLGNTRFGKVADPENSARKVLMFRPNSNDALVSGAPRCEMTFSPSFGGKLPVNQDIWFAFGIRLKDWVNTTDEQILMQWHWSNGSIPLGPFLALSLKGGKLQIDSKANAAYPPAVASTTSRVHWTNGAVASNTWTYFVVKARISAHNVHNPYLKVWRDGTQIVNYAGPFGYNYPEVTPYLKIGHYQWVASYNNWIPAASTKTILVRTPALINDPSGVYSELDVRTHVKNR